MKKINFKTPISYYGGKQSMLNVLLEMLPEHSIYVEPFFGGGALYFAKTPIRVEIINDYNANVVNFYKVLKESFNELKVKIESTSYSRDVYKVALSMYNVPHLFSNLNRAWAFWVCTNAGFSNQIGSWRSSTITAKELIMLNNKKLSINECLSERISKTQIENIDAIELIKRMDTEDTFFYIDPPYVNACQGHYGGYTQEHFNNLLEVLSKIKGKFLLSSYPNDKLNEYKKRFDWKSKQGKKKVECLTFNYDLSNI